MQHEQLVIRLANDADVRILFKWRNSTQSRLMSVHTEPINFDAHQLWFLNAKKDFRYFIYIAELNSIPVGTTRLHFTNDNEAEISIIVDEKFQNRGLGSRILNETILEVEKNFKQKITLYAIIKKNNLSSIKIFKNCGFNQNLAYLDNNFYKFHLILNV